MHMDQDQLDRRAEKQMEKEDKHGKRVNQVFHRILHWLERIIAAITLLVLAITRHVVLAHEDPISNLLSIFCIGALFAVRRFLIRPDELREDLVEEEP